MDIFIDILDFLGFFFLFGGKEYFDDKYTQTGSKMPKILFYIIGILIWAAIIIVAVMIFFASYDLIRNLIVWIIKKI